jgi:hypothetical protein
VFKSLRVCTKHAGLSCMKYFSRIGDIDERVQALQAMKHSLSKQIEQCQKLGTFEECPLMYGLTLPQTINTL